MKKIGVKNMLFIIIALLISVSCSVEKRIYRKGYYITWKSNKHNEIKKESVAIKLQSYELPEIKQDVNQSPILASADKELSIESIKLPKSINIFSDDCGDLIILKNTNEIKAKIVEITETAVKYKPCDNINGPMRSVEKADVFMVKYANGSKETFSKESDKPVQKDEKVAPKKSGKEPFVGNPKKNWAAVLGFILSFFIPIVAVWFCIIGLKSEKRKLAWVGYFICIIFMLLILALTLSGL